jgi:hypothetical protein
VPVNNHRGLTARAAWVTSSATHRQAASLGCQAGARGVTKMNGLSGMGGTEPPMTGMQA